MDVVLTYKDFTASVHFSAEDGAYYGKVLGIDRAVSFEGCTVSELTKCFHEVVDDYLDTCKRLGKPSS